MGNDFLTIGEDRGLTDRKPKQIKVLIGIFETWRKHYENVIRIITQL